MKEKRRRRRRKRCFLFSDLSKEIDRVASYVALTSAHQKVNASLLDRASGEALMDTYTVVGNVGKMPMPEVMSVMFAAVKAELEFITQGSVPDPPLETSLMTALDVMHDVSQKCKTEQALKNVVAAVLKMLSKALTRVLVAEPAQKDELQAALCKVIDLNMKKIPESLHEQIVDSLIIVDPRRGSARQIRDAVAKVVQDSPTGLYKILNVRAQRPKTCKSQHRWRREGLRIHAGRYVCNGGNHGSARR